MKNVIHTAYRYIGTWKCLLVTEFGQHRLSAIIVRYRITRYEDTKTKLYLTFL